MTRANRKIKSPPVKVYKEIVIIRDNVSVCCVIPSAPLSNNKGRRERERESFIEGNKKRCSWITWRHVAVHGDLKKVKLFVKFFPSRTVEFLFSLLLFFF